MPFVNSASFDIVRSCRTPRGVHGEPHCGLVVVVAVDDQGQNVVAAVLVAVERPRADSVGLGIPHAPRDIQVAVVVRDPHLGRLREPTPRRQAEYMVISKGARSSHAASSMTPSITISPERRGMVIGESGEGCTGRSWPCRPPGIARNAASAIRAGRELRVRFTWSFGFAWVPFRRGRGRAAVRNILHGHPAP